MLAILQSIVLQTTTIPYQPTKPVFTLDNFYNILPELIVLGTALLILIVDLIAPRIASGALAVLALIGYAGAGVASLLFIPGIFNTTVPNKRDLFYGFFERDQFTTFFEIAFVITGFLTVLASQQYISRRAMPAAELYALQAFGILGMMLAAAAGDLIAVFVAIELLSISVYILTGFAKDDKGSTEGAIKYFLLGILATAILVYGMAWTFGMTGSTNLRTIGTVLATNKDLVNGSNIDAGVQFGLLMLIVGFGFKIAAVPFHMWTPDAYEGAPTPISGYMSVGPKAAGFAALARVMIECFGQPSPGNTNAVLVQQWTLVIAVLAVFTMTLGNFVGIVQRSVKRMLAYSSIAHTGYMMVGLAAFFTYRPGGAAINGDAINAVLLYAIVYVIMNIGAFAVVAWLQDHGGGPDVEDFAGLSTWAPLPAAAMSIFLLSLTGFPPLAGFVAKFFIFRAAVNSDLVWLAVIGVVNSAIGAFYYLNIIRAMYFSPAKDGVKRPAPRGVGFINAGFALVVIGIVAMGIFPQPILDFARTTGLFG